VCVCVCVCVCVQGREQKSARIYRVLHPVASGPARADLKTPPAGGKVDGSSVADAGDGQVRT
jgi:hypothetical protein